MKHARRFRDIFRVAMVRSFSVTARTKLSLAFSRDWTAMYHYCRAIWNERFVSNKIFIIQNVGIFKCAQPTWHEPSTFCQDFTVGATPPSTAWISTTPGQNWKWFTKKMTPQKRPGDKSSSDISVSGTLNYSLDQGFPANSFIFWNLDFTHKLLQLRTK